jgi:hypothetical protein
MYPAFRTMWQRQKLSVYVRCARFNGQSLAQAMFRELDRCPPKARVTRSSRVGRARPSLCCNVLCAPEPKLQFCLTRASKQSGENRRRAMHPRNLGGQAASSSASFWAATRSSPQETGQLRAFCESRSNAQAPCLVSMPSRNPRRREPDRPGRPPLRPPAWRQADIGLL